MLLAALIAVASRGAAWDQAALIALARAAVSAEVNGKASPKPQTKSSPRPVFVTIEHNGRIMGCRGGLETRSNSLEEEVILSARAAARHDPRYAPLKPEDLKDYQVTVTIVDRTEPLDDIQTLRPRDGLVLKAGTRTGVVLPWEGKAPETRLKWAYKKAGVQPGASCQIYRLIAERFRR